MYCSNCGSAQPDDLRSCRRCGAQLSAGQTSQVGEAGDPRSYSPSSQPSQGRSVPSGRHKVLTALVILALVALTVTGWRMHWPPGVFGAENSASQNTNASSATVHRAPADAMKAVYNLASRNPATLRRALAADYSAQVNSAALAPIGTRIRVQPGSWRQHATAASVQVLVTVPGRTPVTEVVYLVREEGRWRVLFTSAPSSG